MKQYDMIAVDNYHLLFVAVPSFFFLLLFFPSSCTFRTHLKWEHGNQQRDKRKNYLDKCFLWIKYKVTQKVYGVVCVYNKGRE